VLEELGPEMATNSPGDFENTGEFANHAYTFINHHLDAEIDKSARSATGPSLDGKGEFRVAEPNVASAPQPRLQNAPPEVHTGADSTATDGAGPAVGAASRLPRLAGDLADRVTSTRAATASDYDDMTRRTSSRRLARPVPRAARARTRTNSCERCRTRRRAPSTVADSRASTSGRLDAAPMR
jgi:hypothetical protein